MLTGSTRSLPTASPPPAGLPEANGTFVSACTLASHGLVARNCKRSTSDRPVPHSASPTRACLCGLSPEQCLRLWHGSEAIITLALIIIIIIVIHSTDSNTTKTTNNNDDHRHGLWRRLRRWRSLLLLGEWCISCMCVCINIYIYIYNGIERERCCLRRWRSRLSRAAWRRPRRCGPRQAPAASNHWPAKEEPQKGSAQKVT